MNDVADAFLLAGRIESLRSYVNRILFYKQKSESANFSVYGNGPS
jgi:hypothetical protein